MTAPFTCRMITDAAELAALAPEWWELWRTSPAATPFQSPAWLLPWWNNLADGEACVLAIRTGKRLVGLAPLYCERRAQGRLVRLMGFPVTDYQDFLIAPTLEGPALAVLRSHLTDADFWDVLELAELPPNASALRMPAPGGYGERTANASACPVLGLPDVFDGPPRVIPARTRRALRTARNRAERRGSLQILAADRNSVLESFEILVALHRQRWNSRGEPGVLADSRVRQFHRDALPALMDAGLLRLYVLQIAGHAAAAYYGLVHRNQAYGYLTGFDPAYAYESPSVILLGFVLDEASREATREYHFLRGREPYKYGWGARDCWNKCRVFHRSKASCHDIARRD
ncbi:GNAT family N-acetyltransferase [Bradyrhizobium sp. ISRA442]|uniref:GNAT family N-acetyltransferase n=1 Tax=Bradyrhizobium sp. ISRA442 TaxID=2866197 RepID=UPI00311AC2CC